jgi:2-polyprenyl-3-methyl-5-hydroxy-6-metoxy-1,4-benzoquinol methylase
MESQPFAVGKPGVIYRTLVALNLVRAETVRVVANHTRDRKGIDVLHDEVSGVFFIDNHYVGVNEYETGAYRSTPKPGMDTSRHDFEDAVDTERRISSFAKYFTGRTICDFGCGAGSFLRRAQEVAHDLTGVELNKEFQETLNAEGIQCLADIGSSGKKFDTIFLFHSFEHLPSPLEMLKELKGHLKDAGAGRVVIEVPHARDFLIGTLMIQEFIQFTFWSQHLILHTRASLEAFLREAGFKNIVVSGVQRYGLSNHIQWLKDKKPGGHRSNLAALDVEPLRQAYADSLSRLDANDTLIAVATT